jgi:hypothetical protein
MTQVLMQSIRENKKVGQITVFNVTALFNPSDKTPELMSQTTVAGNVWFYRFFCVSAASVLVL